MFELLDESNSVIRKGTLDIISTSGVVFDYDFVNSLDVGSSAHAQYRECLNTSG